MARQNRGELWVVAQLVLLGGIFLAPFLDDGWPIAGLNPLSRVAGLFAGLAGLALVALAAGSLNASFTIFPRPKDNGVLSQSGVYGIVRHPMYGGVILAALGWSLFWISPLGAILTIALGLFFDRKAHQEEIWLQERYPEYARYRKRVRKLIPWVY